MSMTLSSVQLEGGLNSKMALNHDVVESPAENAATPLEGIYDKFNGIREVYRKNCRNFETTPMKLSEEIDNFNAECYNSLSVMFGHCECHNNEKIVFLVMKFEK